MNFSFISTYFNSIRYASKMLVITVIVDSWDTILHLVVAFYFGYDKPND